MTPYALIINKTTFKQIQRTISIFILAAFVGTSVQSPVYASIVSSYSLPKVGVMVNLSRPFRPVTLVGLTIHPDSPLEMDFVVNEGDEILGKAELNAQATKLVRYFLTALTTATSDLWVNLSPIEHSRIVPQVLGTTEMGRDMLAQDYLLKQTTASMIHPDGKIGKEFWDSVYRQISQRYGTTQVPINTFNKVWIIPDSADVYENGNTALVGKVHLKVMLEADYKIMMSRRAGNINKADSVSINNVGTDVVRQIIIPQLEREVNEGKNFKEVRQIYSALVLAAWYKRTLTDSILRKIFINKNKVAGIDLQDKTVKEKIFNQYVRSYKKGVFNFIREESDSSGELLPRKYFSGGISNAMLTRVIQYHSIVASGQAMVRSLLSVARKKTFVFRYALVPDRTTLRTIGNIFKSSPTLAGVAASLFTGLPQAQAGAVKYSKLVEVRSPDLQNQQIAQLQNGLPPGVYTNMLSTFDANTRDAMRGFTTGVPVFDSQAAFIRNIQSSFGSIDNFLTFVNQLKARFGAQQTSDDLTNMKSPYDNLYTLAINSHGDLMEIIKAIDNYMGEGFLNNLFNNRPADFYDLMVQMAQMYGEPGENGAPVRYSEDIPKAFSLLEAVFGKEDLQAAINKNYRLLWMFHVTYQGFKGKTVEDFNAAIQKLQDLGLFQSKHNFLLDHLAGDATLWQEFLAWELNGKSESLASYEALGRLVGFNAVTKLVDRPYYSIPETQNDPFGKIGHSVSQDLESASSKHDYYNHTNLTQWLSESATNVAPREVWQKIANANQPGFLYLLEQWPLLTRNYSVPALKHALGVVADSPGINDGSSAGLSIRVGLEADKYPGTTPKSKNFSKRVSSNSSPAQLIPVGGINFDMSLIKFNITGQRQRFDWQFDPNTLLNMKIDGLVPVLIDDKTINLQKMLGISD